MQEGPMRNPGFAKVEEPENLEEEKQEKASLEEGKQCKENLENAKSFKIYF